MTTKQYLMIENNEVINNVMWDGNTESWNPPTTSTCLVKESTPTKIWKFNVEAQDYVLTESIGDADIGFTYDGSFVITNQEKPLMQPQPIVDGIETI